jgi:hypothetical protein
VSLQRLLIICLTFSSLGLAQLSYGIKGGAFLTDPAERFDQGRRYVIGAAVEAELINRIAVEGNALYSRFGSSLGLAGGQRIRGDAWSFPVLGKYYLAGRDNLVRPFAAGGVEFRKIWFDSSRRPRGFGGDSSDLGIGAVASGGVALRAWRLKVAPEIRYTRWGGDNFPATNDHQVQVLLGIGF